MNEKVTANLERLKPTIVDRVFEHSQEWGMKSKIFPTKPSDLSPIKERVWDFIGSPEFQKYGSKQNREDMADLLSELYGVPIYVQGSTEYQESDIPYLVCLTPSTDIGGGKKDIAIIKKFSGAWVSGTGKDAIFLSNDKIGPMYLRLATKEEIAYLVENVFRPDISPIESINMFFKLLKNKNDKEQRDFVFKSIKKITETFFDSKPRMTEELTQQEIDCFRMDVDVNTKKAIFKTFGLKWTEKKWKEWNETNNQTIESFPAHVSIVVLGDDEKILLESGYVPEAGSENAFFTCNKKIGGVLPIENKNWSAIRQPTDDELRSFVNDMNLAMAWQLIVDPKEEDQFATWLDGLS